jgi:hypothetical protein
VCKICADRFNIHERVANHNFWEQIEEFYGMEPKYIKKRTSKNYRKSILNQIEYQLYRLQLTNDIEHYQKLRTLLVIDDINELQQKFNDLMIDYYLGKLETIQC